jgi:hypothetical protein
MALIFHISGGSISSINIQPESPIPGGEVMTLFRNESINHSHMQHAYAVIDFVLDSLKFSTAVTREDLVFKVSLADVRDAGTDQHFGFCSKKSEPLNLIPDPYFIKSKSYSNDESHARPFESRIAKLFWRGMASFPLKTGDIYEEIPRVKAALTLLTNPNADVKVYCPGPSSKYFDTKELELGYLSSLDILGRPFPMDEWAKYKFTLDVDGFGSAWGFFHKLKIGMVVLKVESELVQWFNQYLEPYVHYIPVAADLSDLQEKLSFISQNNSLSSEISKNAIEVASRLNYEFACRDFIRKLNSFKLESV